MTRLGWILLLTGFGILAQQCGSGNAVAEREEGNLMLADSDASAAESNRDSAESRSSEGARTTQPDTNQTEPRASVRAELSAENQSLPSDWVRDGDGEVLQAMVGSELTTSTQRGGSVSDLLSASRDPVADAAPDADLSGMIRVTIEEDGRQRVIAIDPAPVTAADLAQAMRGSSSFPSGTVLTAEGNAQCHVDHPDRAGFAANCISWMGAKAYCESRGLQLPKLEHYQALEAQGLIEKPCNYDSLANPVTCQAEGGSDGAIVMTLAEMTESTMVFENQTPVHPFGVGAPSAHRYPYVAGSTARSVTPYEMVYNDAAVLRFPHAISAPHLGFRCAFDNSVETESVESLEEEQALLLSWLSDIPDLADSESGIVPASLREAESRTQTRSLGDEGSVEMFCRGGLPCAGGGRLRGMIYLPERQIVQKVVKAGEAAVERTLLQEPIWMDRGMVTALRFEEHRDKLILQDGDVFTFDPLDETRQYCRMGNRDLDHLPMNCVSQRAAASYCQLLNKRLPTEADVASIHAQPDLDVAASQFALRYLPEAERDAATAQAIRENLYGVEIDPIMWEWTRDDFANVSPGAVTNPEVTLPLHNLKARVRHGNDRGTAFSSRRSGLAPRQTTIDTGFRCVDAA